MSSELLFQVELVWNREFDWVSYSSPHPTLEEAITLAQAIQDSGDGARVKKTRVVDSNGKVRWAYGKIVPVE
jgi:hypothetical protein